MDANGRAYELYEKYCVDDWDGYTREAFLLAASKAIRSAESEAAEKARREALEEVERILAYAPPGSERADFFKAVRSLASSPGKESDR